MQVLDKTIGSKTKVSDMKPNAVFKIQNDKDGSWSTWIKLTAEFFPTHGSSILELLKGGCLVCNVANGALGLMAAEQLGQEYEATLRIDMLKV